MGMKVDITWKPNQQITEHTAIAISGSSQKFTAVGAQTYAARISSTGNCHYCLISGVNTAATANSAYLAAGQVDIIGVAPGDVIAVIRDGVATGNCTLTELTH